MKYIPYLNKRFVDVEDNITFKVHAICKNPAYSEIMFQYYAIKEGEDKDDEKKSDVPMNMDDFEYSADFKFKPDQNVAIFEEKFKNDNNDKVRKQEHVPLLLREYKV